MGTKTYDPAQIIATVGPAIITGFADGTFVKASRETDTFTDYAGADGEVTRARSRDKRGTVEFTLSQASPSNDLLSALATMDEQLGTGIVPFLLKDVNGTTLCAGGEAWVKKPADVEYGKEVGTRAWTIRVARLLTFAGGAVF